MNAAKNRINRAYLGLGSNIEPEKYLPKAIDLLKEQGELKAVSNAWETQAVGSDGPNFLNAAVLFLTAMDAPQLKHSVLRVIEANLGRERGNDKNSPRTIDIDILMFNDQLIEPEIWEYAHLAVPLAEIHPDFFNPDTGVTLMEVAKLLRETHFMQPHPEVFSP